MYVGTYDAWVAQMSPADCTGVDVDVMMLESLEITHAKALTERAVRRPIVAEKRSFIIVCSQLTREAQNTLLKLFEDPPVTAQFM